MDKVILLDNGHGENTDGKRSPDWTLMEWKYTRQIVKKIHKQLIDKGYDARILVPEDIDVALNTRCKRVNAIVDEYGRDNVILISVHCNAAGSDGKWHNARGWQIHTYLNPGEETQRLANTIFDEAVECGVKTRRPSHDLKYWQNDFWILKHTKCPAVLTENFFQDNKDDVAFLLSDTGKNTVTSIHVNAIMKYCK